MNSMPFMFVLFTLILSVRPVALCVR